MNYSQISQELVRRFQEDQELLRQKDWVNLEAICDRNVDWLKKIIAKVGWLDEQKVGDQGEQAAWLIVQHASDISFQESCLQFLQQLPETVSRLGYIAYLTDRILVKKGKPQVYGTQFSYGKPFPITDPENLDKRRSQMYLDS